MGNKVLCFLPAIIGCALEDNKTSLSRSCSEDQAIFPGRPRDTVDARLELLGENFVLPAIVKVAFPYLHKAIIAACGDNTLVFGVRPCDLPDRATVSLERPLTSFHGLSLVLLLLLLLLSEVITHTADLQETFAITRGNLGTIVVKLTIIDIILMLGVDWEGSCAWIGSLCISSSTWNCTGSGWLPICRCSTSALLYSVLSHLVSEFSSFRVKNTFL